MIRPVLLVVGMSSPKAVKCSSSLADCSLDLDDVGYCCKKVSNGQEWGKLYFAECLQLECEEKIQCLQIYIKLIVSCVTFTCIV